MLNIWNELVLFFFGLDVFFLGTGAEIRGPGKGFPFF